MKKYILIGLLAAFAMSPAMLPESHAAATTMAGKHHKGHFKGHKGHKGHKGKHGKRHHKGHR